MKILPADQHFKEEVANTFTHGLGLIFSIVALVVLIVYSSMKGTTLHVVSCTIFGSSLVLLYLASSLYHAVSHVHLKNHLFRRLDHICIYFLIAGTYTPFALLALRGPSGWTIFAVVWFLAIAGTFFKIFWGARYPFLSILGYILMGWVVIFAIKPLVLNLALGGLILLVLGGLFYTVGCYFYLKDEKICYFHALWHIMVMIGSLCHFLSVFFYLIP